MVLKKLALFILFLLLFSPLAFLSQIVATPSTGCAPLSVQFSGPPGASNVLWNLGSGIGPSSNTNPNPIYNTAGTYNITYTAIVGGQPVSYNMQIVVFPNPSASFTFSLPASHCAPLTATLVGSGGSPGSSYNWAFGDLSTSLNNGSVVTHPYSSGGSYVPVMTVVDAITGCTAVASGPSPGTITVSNPPNPVISSSQGFIGCTPPFVTSISGSLSTSGSPVAGPLSLYNWAFNGGSPATSGAPNPGPVTFAIGQSTIVLTVTDNNQCSKTTSTTLLVGNPSLTVNSPSMVCNGVPFAATVQTNQQSTTWTFSGGGVTNTIIPITPGIQTYTVHKYITPGQQTYTVSVSAGGTCAPVSQVHNVFVEYVVGNFTRTPLQPPHTTCQPSLAVTYSNQSVTNSGATLSYTWSATWQGGYNNIYLAPPSASNATNPTFTMTQGSINPYTIYNYFEGNIYLYVQSNSSAGCLDTIWHTDMDTIMRATAWLIANKKEGCAPLTVRFNDSSFSFPSIFPLTSYTWCNGATPPITVTGTLALPPSSQSVIPSQTFSYTNPGTYYPYIMIKTNYGCVEKSFIDTIHVGSPPVIGPLVVTPSPSACAGQAVNVQMTATSSAVSGGINHWHVTSDNGFFSGCVSNSSPTYSFSHLGVHGFTVFADEHICGSQAVSAQSILIKGPLGRFTYSTNCNVNKKSVSFMVHLQETQTAVLDYGDGITVNLSGSSIGTYSTITTHTYNSRGDYTVTLTSNNGTNGCGPNIFKQVVKIREPRAKITYNGLPMPVLPNAVSCKNARYKFSATSSVDAYTTCCSGFVWTLMTPNYTLHPVDIKYPMFALNNPLPWPYLPPWSPTVSILDEVSLDTFRVAGNYTINLAIKDENDCVDTTTSVFRISSAKPSFTFNINPLCLSTGSVQIINTTQSQQVPPDQITNYIWDFGDGTGVTTSTNPLFNPVHTFPFAFPPSQPFLVTCTASNNVGCTDTTKHTIIVNNPYANFQPSNSFPCIPLNQSTNVNFTANSGFVTYSLSFGDPPSSPTWQYLNNFNNISHQYSTPGTYVATLNVSDNLGCKSTTSQTVTAIGQPTALIGFVNDENKFCLPGAPLIVSNSTINVTPITNYVWTMGSLTAQGTPSMSTLLTSTGVFTLQLNVDVGGHCQSTDTASVFVFDPSAKLKLDKNKFCLGDTIHVSVIDSSMVWGWKWFFGDNVTQQPFLAGSVLAQYTKTLSYPYTTFPNSGISGQTVLSLLYYGPGETCRKTSTTNITVIKLDGNFMQNDSVYRHCLGPPDGFKDITPNPNNLGYVYKWTIAGTPGPSAPTASFTFGQPGQYPVILNIEDDTYHCKTTAIKNMTILPLPQASVFVPDTSCPNTTFTINGSGIPGVSGSLTGTLLPVISNASLSFNSQNTFSTSASASISTTYSLMVTDDNNCQSKPATASIYVQQPATPVQWDTTVIIGQPIPLNAYAGSNFTYSWSPLASNITCTNCYNPLSTTTVDLTYTVTMEDTPLGCFKTVSTYKIKIDPRTTIDVPTAFTPNGDGNNDFIFPDGWGVRRLLYFKVFNRWGQLLFETNEFKVGWDGKFNGMPQNMETYVYQVSVDTYTNETISKTGTFKLLR